MEDDLIARGRDIFVNETFDGNGRTCVTCHRVENNFTLDPEFIATLPDNDPLFVAEFNPDLKENLENPRLLREFGLIIENLDGFDDLSNKFTLRGVPHLLGLQNSVDSPEGARTGWSGDGAPGDGTLRSFATGAVIQHFTKTLDRVPGIDFRLPTDEELDALEAFMLSLGRQEELPLPLPFRDSVAKRGQDLFSDSSRGKCALCHFNAGANADPSVFGEGAGNLNFNTGVENLPDQPAGLTGELIPPDDGFGTPGDGTFNTPPVVEAADTGPFFHNNSVKTIEGAVAFYNGASFNNSPAGQTLDSLTDGPIVLDATEVEAIAVFLRVINALENIRQSKMFLEAFIEGEPLANEEFEKLPERVAHEISDAIRVLSEGRVHIRAVMHLKNALALIEQTMRKGELEKALTELRLARNELITTTKSKGGKK